MKRQAEAFEVKIDHLIDLLCEGDFTDEGKVRARLQTLIGDGMTPNGFVEAVRKASSSELSKRHRLTFEWFISDDNWRDGRFVCSYI
jgi:hypothetical protein